MKKKILIFLLVFIIAIIPVISFAEEITVLPPNDGHKYYYCFYNPSYLGWECITSDGKLYLANDGFLTFKPISYARFYKLNETTGLWEIGNNGNFGPVYTTTNFKASNVDIYYWDEVTVFFSVPRVSPLLSTMKSQSPVATLKIILAGLIPLLGLVILGICLRKGWAFLRRQLTT